MKCNSVACLWPPTAPLQHRVTAAVALHHHSYPLFTGAADGSILWWSLYSQEQEQEQEPRHYRPIAVLCGHAAPIVSLFQCSPSPSTSPSLLSACADSVLCVWDAVTGRCRRRRGLPPWAGGPLILCPMPSSPRHVCVACLSHDSPGHLHEAARCAVLIVDTYSLNVVQTLFHGSLAISVPKSMSVIPSLEEDGKSQTVILVDGHGKAQFLAASKESDPSGEAASGFQRSSSVEALSSASGESSSDGIVAVTITNNGELLAVVYDNRCVFNYVPNGVHLEEISLAGSSLCSEDLSHLSGCMFMERYISGVELGTKDSAEGFKWRFAVWSTSGAVMIYDISSSVDLDFPFRFEAVCEVPAIPDWTNVRASVTFCQLDQSLFRITSVGTKVGQSELWQPHVTIWALDQFSLRNDCSSGSLKLSMLLGRGTLPSGLNREWSSDPKSSDVPRGQQYDDGDGLNERIISSSIIVHEYFFSPYAVVYGFYNGDIDVVRFASIFPEASSGAKSLHHQTGPLISEQHFSGHTGAVLCLAAHRMTANSETQNFCRALVSGSMDCTVRIWDLDTGSLLLVMHHHVTPVRQIILAPPGTYRPWNDCFLSVGEDCCVALVSLETLWVERMFPGHPSYPFKVVWDTTRGYLACLCKNTLSSSDGISMLYLWDVKTGCRERIIRGTASHSMFDHFCRGVNANFSTVTTSVSSLLLPVFEDANVLPSHVVNSEKGTNMKRNPMLDSSQGQKSKGKATLPSAAHDISYDLAGSSSIRQDSPHQIHQHKKHPIRCSCPFPGIATLKFDLSSLVSPLPNQHIDNKISTYDSGLKIKEQALQHESSSKNSAEHRTEGHSMKEFLEECLLRFSLSLLHLWGVDLALDKLLAEEMNICKPKGFFIASGVLGDRDSLTLMFPGLHATLELWKSSAEFCAMRSLAVVSLAQRMISLSHSTSTASSALAAFYTRNFAEEFPDIKPPLLQLLVSFWQDPSEHVRMAARSLFHCAAPRAIPRPLASNAHILEKCVANGMENTSSSRCTDPCRVGGGLTSDDLEESDIIAWLESFDIHGWTSCIGRTSQDAIAAHIIVASALVVWYPSIVKQKLPKLVVNRLLKLVMSTNEHYSSTAAELLAEGMESTWKTCIGPEVSSLIRDIFLQIECLSGVPVNNSVQNPVVSVNVREALVGILLPSLAMADIPGFLNVIEGQIWATSSDSPVHVVSLKTVIRVVRGTPKPLAPYLDKVVTYALQTMDYANLVMRKACLSSSMVTLREIARVFPMVALNETSMRLAVGDAVGDIHSVSIRVYDLESVTLIKVLDASGPPGLPSLLEGASNVKSTTAITVLSFSPDGEGLVAFSENGLMIRWWSVETAWWEKLSRSVVPVQCTKLIFVPPWEGFSPNTSRSSIMAGITGHGNERVNSEDKPREMDDAERLKLLLHNLDLSYRLQWTGGRQVVLIRHGHELGSFQL